MPSPHWTPTVWVRTAKTDSSGIAAGGVFSKVGTSACRDFVESRFEVQKLNNVKPITKRAAIARAGLKK